MKIEKIFCDACGYEFKKVENEDSAPARVRLIIDTLRQPSRKSLDYYHVCSDCVDAIESAVSNVVASSRETRLLIFKEND